MDRRKKTVRSFRNSSSEASFKDAEQLLKDFGFEETHSTGSHHRFKHEDGRHITICKVKGKKVKKIYIQKIIECLNLEDWDADEEEGN